MSITDKLQRGATLIRNLPSLARVLSPLDTRAPWSELGYWNYESAHHFARALRSSVFPVYAPFREVPHLPYEVPEHQPAIDDNQKWLFLNGICTDRSVLRLNGKALADIFGRKIYLMHNPSDGVVLDLLECAVGRTMQIISTLDESVSHILEDALEHNDKVVFIAHSQGGIIATGALYKLARRLPRDRSQLLNKLEVYTFSSAATECDVPQVYAEHFLHTHDYVAQIGVGANPDRFSGRIFRSQGTGHLMNTHYLTSFLNGRFKAHDGGTSRLAEYLFGPVLTRGTPRANHILPLPVA